MQNYRVYRIRYQFALFCSRAFTAKQEKEKPLWVHCYLQQGHDLNKEFIKDVSKDSRITGLMLYEVVWNKREDDGIIRVDDNGEVTFML